MRRIAPHVAVWLGALHLTLSVAAAVCVFDHAAAKPAGHHAAHHQKDARAHSTLCAWACQANPGAVLITAAPLIHGTLLALAVLLIASSAPFKILSVRLHPRGPPLPS